MSSVHFEVFRSSGKSGWSLVEAMSDRNAALAKANELLNSGQAKAAKVVKETLQGDGDYMALTIFEEDRSGQMKKQNTEDDKPENPIPCFKPDDLYSYHARMTMMRLLGEWLGRYKLTITELTHSAAALEKFEATGTTYQHAIQKIAVAEAQGSAFPVSKIVKTLNELCTVAINRVYKDEKRGQFPKYKTEEFGPLTVTLAGKPDSRYLLNGALAKYLADVKTWDEKLRRLLALVPVIAADGPERVLLFTAVDGLLSEMLTGAAALGDMLGPNQDLGHALFNLAELFLGTRQPTEGSSEGLNELARYFAKDELPEARGAIANRIITELKGMKRLCPSSLDEELKMLRKLANTLVRGQGKYLAHDDLITAFTERSKRLVTHEPLAQFLSTAKTPDEKFERLLVVEENIIGAENKRALAVFIMPIIAHNTFEDQILGPLAQPMQRLKRLVELQTRTQRSGLQDVQKGQITAQLDVAACHIEARAKMLTGIETRVPNPAERTQAILKLFQAGVLTEGTLITKARQILLASISKPGFLTSYLARTKPESATANRETVVSELIMQLQKAGLTDGLRTIAA